MTEEKKLDDKTLEGVTGGADAAGGSYEDLPRTDCSICAKRNNGCPYDYNDDAAARHAILAGLEACPHFSELPGFARPKQGFVRPK